MQCEMQPRRKGEGRKMSERRINTKKKKELKTNLNLSTNLLLMRYLSFFSPPFSLLLRRSVAVVFTRLTLGARILDRSYGFYTHRRRRRHCTGASSRAKIAFKLAAFFPPSIRPKLI